MKTTETLLSFFTSFNMLLMAAELFFCFRFPKRSHFGLRLLLPAGFIILLGVNDISIMIGTVRVPQILYGVSHYFNLYYLVMLMISIIILMFLFEEKIIDILYYAVSAYITEHICSHAMQLFTALTGRRIAGMATELILFLIVIFAIYFIWIRNSEREQIQQDNKTILFFVALTMIFQSMFSSIVYALDYVTPITHIYELLISFLLIMIQYGFYTIARTVAERQVVESVIAERSSQQELYNENMQYISMKCHDLKAQIELLKNLQTDEERRRNVEKLEQAVLIQGTKIKTGNNVVDVILMEKHLICQQNDITLTTVVDGTAIAFMETADIVMLLGNALNNAIEAVQKCEKDSREIAFRIEKSGNFIRISVDNYYTGTLCFNGEMPVSTKKDNAAEHGYGMKSIENIVKKYGGNMRIHTEGNSFCLSILFQAAAGEEKIL